MGNVPLAVSIDHRGEGFTAKSALREHNAAAAITSRKSITTKEGLRLYSSKEAAKKAGPVISYSASKPMAWKAFYSMPKDAQKGYIELLLKTYPGIGVRDLCAMFGIRESRLRDYVGKFGIKLTSKTSRGEQEKANIKRFREVMSLPVSGDYSALIKSAKAESEDKAKLVCALYKAGKTQAEIQKIADANNRYVHAVLFKFGLLPEKRVAEVEKSCKKLYADGVGLLEISTRLRVYVPDLKKILGLEVKTETTKQPAPAVEPAKADVAVTPPAKAEEVPAEPADKPVVKAEPKKAKPVAKPVAEPEPQPSFSLRNISFACDAEDLVSVVKRFALSGKIEVVINTL